MSNLIGFEAYSKRAKRLKLLEELQIAVKELNLAAKGDDPARRYKALGKVFELSAELDKLPPPQNSNPA